MGAAWGLGVDAQTIRTGLDSFGTLRPQTLVIA
jgi:hypothetical protein